MPGILYIYNIAHQHFWWNNQNVTPLHFLRVGHIKYAILKLLRIQGSYFKIEKNTFSLLASLSLKKNYFKGLSFKCFARSLLRLFRLSLGFPCIFYKLVADMLYLLLICSSFAYMALCFYLFLFHLFHPLHHSSCCLSFCSLLYLATSIETLVVSHGKIIRKWQPLHDICDDFSYFEFFIEIFFFYIK